MKSVLSSDCLNAYPDLNKPFETFTDKSDYQLGIGRTSRRLLLQKAARLGTEELYYYGKGIVIHRHDAEGIQKNPLGREDYRLDRSQNLVFRTLSVQRVL